MPKKGVIIEIAPGGTDKIIKGLALIKFEGKIYFVEPNKTALKLTLKKCKNLIPKAKIISINKKLKDSASLLPKSADALVSNHPLDDMIISEYVSNKEFDELFKNRDIREEVEHTKRLWKKFELSNKKPVILIKVFEEWNKLIKQTTPKILIISQYNGSFYKENKIKWPDKYAFIVLNKLKKEYKKYEDKNILIKRSSLRDKNRWLILNGNKF